MRNRKLTILATAAVVFLLISPGVAVLTNVTMVDTPSQDPLIVATIVDELGNKPLFPDDEWITSSDTTTSYVPCPGDDEMGTHVEVTITNKTTKTFAWLVYVADPETSLTNDDGLVNGQLAFNIDATGLYNTPLVYESSPGNPAFEPGETWKFVIQDYFNSRGLAASLFGSIGVPTGGDDISSGSIIPEPATLSLVVLGGLALIRRRRRA